MTEMEVFYEFSRSSRDGLSAHWASDLLYFESDRGPSQGGHASLLRSDFARTRKSKTFRCWQKFALQASQSFARKWFS
ncbi:hypothetical protein D3C72_2039390 [compost metagenome]